jgi:DNA-binding YbaB/EbfC family protein
MGSGFAKQKKQAKEMQKQFATLQEKMKTSTFEGSAGNGLVTLTLSGEFALKSLKIKPECVDKDDLEGLEDLIIAAHQAAFKKAEAESLQGLPQGLPF